MEKKNSDSKRKSMSKSNEEPPDKKACRNISIEDILPPSQDRCKDLSTHCIEHVEGNSSSSKDNVSQNNGGNEIAASDESISRKSNHKTNSKSSQTKSNKDDATDDSTTPLPPCSSVEEVTGIRLSSSTSADKAIVNEPQNKDDKSDTKKIKWKCERHFSDHGTNAIGAETSSTPIANDIADPQTSKNSFTTLRNKCVYGSKCYRKSSGHKAKFSHPGDSDYDIKDNRPECRYGVKCYRKDPKHKNDFKHTVMRRKRAQTPVRAITPETYESGSDHSSVEESIDESEYDPSGLDYSSDDDDGGSDW